jgi:hypothetical protein
VSIGLERLGGSFGPPEHRRRDPDPVRRDASLNNFDGDGAEHVPGSSVDPLASLDGSGAS